MKKALLLLVFFCGCATLNTNSLGYNKVVADRSVKWYEATYIELGEIYDKASPAVQKEMRKEINPRVNELKRALVVYVDMLSLWESTGKRPVGFVEIAARIDILSQSILALKDKLHKVGEVSVGTGGVQ